MCDTSVKWNPFERNDQYMKDQATKDHPEEAAVLSGQPPAPPLPALPPPAPTLTDLVAKWNTEYQLEKQPQAGSRQSQFTSGAEGDTTMPLLGGATKTKLGGG